MKTITCTSGKVMLVDDDDFEWMSKMTWGTKSTKRVAEASFYAQTSVRISTGKWMTVPAARMIMRAGPGVDVDHRNGNTLDNQKHNLRAGTRQGNHLGFRKKTPGKTSRYRGVYWESGRSKWRAVVQGKLLHPRKDVIVGRFSSEEEAALAYNAAAIKFGFHPEALNKVA